jgi:hypothetical protein
MHRQAVVQNVVELRTETPASLADAVSKALEKAPEDRWQTASEMMEVVNRG